MRKIALALAALPLLAQPALAEVPGPSDQTAIRQMILGQMSAFQAEDGATAFSFASPAIREIFRTEGTFMEMVRQGYPQVYRPRDVAFGRIVELDGRLIQEVFVVGPGGSSWIAAYEVVRQADGTWRINGVVIVRDRTGAMT